MFEYKNFYDENNFASNKTLGIWARRSPTDSRMDTSI